MKALVFAAVFATGLLAALAGVVQAASIAYDGIQYPPGPLAGNGPAFGFMAPWAADPGISVVGAGLASLLALPSAGGAVAGGFNFQAPLSSTLAPSPGKEFWASFLIRHETQNDQTFMGLSATGAPFGDPPAVGFGVQLERYGIFVGGAFTPAPTAYTAYPSTDLLVTHFTAGGATWNVELFVNPSSFSMPALVMNVAPVTYGTMVNLNETGFESDEFRLGDEAGDVAAAGATDVPPGAATATAGVELSIAPSPSRGLARIDFVVAREAPVRLSVIDVQGRVLATLADRVYRPGHYQATWNANAFGSRVAPGVYYVSLWSPGIEITRKVLLMR